MRKILTIVCTLGAIVLGVTSVSAQKGNKKKAKEEAVLTQTAEQVVDSLKIIEEAAKNGDAEAQNILGEWYYTGRHYKQDYETAAKWWARAAKQDNIYAIGNLGLCYQNGRGVQQDSLRATELYLNSIRKGNKQLFNDNVELAKKENVFSSMLVATCYLKGYGVNKDEKKAIPYLTIAARKGAPVAQNDLGLLLLKEKKYSEAAPWVKKGSENGNVDCTYYYGRMLIDGRGVKKDAKEGANYLLKAAEAGMPEAMNSVANCYMTGEGLTKNAGQAVVWYKKAAGKGVKNAQWELATCYREGNGTLPNYDQALYWYGEAYTNGYADRFKKLIADSIAGSPFVAYMKGMKDYYNNDFDAALKEFKIVEKAKVFDGNIMEAAIQANANYKKTNLKKGIKMLEKAAQTSPQAMYLLGGLYEGGKGVDKDMAKAVEYMTKAADLGYARAQCALADMYYEGRGVEKSYEMAVKYYNAAYEQGQLTENAAKRFADCYKEGNGVSPDDEKAADILNSVSKSHVMELLRLV